ncbi:MAG: GatB/YqeY domain-containing protein [Bacilli bacterium]|nr:GatB/YqeY domain-containing protein [Bacilli bacterium]
MELVEKLKNDMIGAMKAKDKERLTVIRMVKAALDKERIDKKVEINDGLLIDVVNKQVKLRKDSIEEFKKASRTDLIEKTEHELNVLMDYLPEPLSKEEVDRIIEEEIKNVNAESIKDMGKIMKQVTPRVKGKFDMRQVSEIIKKKLN